MNMYCLNKPKFCCHQTVSFIGGVGKIKNIQRQNSRWAYIIEMSMGKQPTFARIGAETTILLEEQDIRQVNKVIS